MAVLETVLGMFPPAGVVVFVPAYGLWRHKGIVSDRWHNWKPMILCNSPIHGIIEQPWDEFFGEEPLRHESYPGSLPAHEVLRRARSRLGESYFLFTFNCDHYKNYAHGLPIESEQLRATFAVLGSLSAVAAAFARG